MALLLVVFMAGCGREQGVIIPTLTAISPNRGTQGQTVPVTLTGTSFTTGATINGAGAGITVSNTTVVSSSTITATFAISTSAALGTVNISVTSSGQTTNTVTYTIGPAFTVSSVIPANGASNVLINQVLSATFSQAVNCATITTTGAAPSFTLTGPTGAVAVTLTSCSASTATFTPTSLLASNASYTATLTTAVQDSLGDPLLSNFVWSFSTAPLPTVTSTIPTNGATGVPVNQVLTATFSEAMTCSTIASPATTFTVTGPAPGLAVVGGTVTCSGATATFTLTSGTLLAANTTYTAKITTGVKNLGGGALASNYSWIFTTELVPTVISTVPTNLATGVPVNQVLTATFSEAMNCATLTSPATTFTVTGPAPGLAVVAGTVNCLGTSATFTPTSLLAANTLYTATITTGATSPTGAPLATKYVWTFTTELPPTVISTVPISGATGVPFYQVLTANFSEEMNCATVLTSFTLSGGGGGLVACSGASATFTPASSLAPSTSYTATITGATSLTGAPLATYSWSFKTGAAPPTVTAIAPLNNATGVGLNTAITAQFDEAMQGATVTGAFTLRAGGAASLTTPCVASAGTLVGGTPTYSATNNIITFTPTSPGLAPLTCYTATISTGATSSGSPGIAMAANYVWVFATGAAPAVTPPTVISTIPVTATPPVTGVPLNQEITATFSEAMNDTTITSGTSGTFTLTYGTPAVSVSGVVGYIAGTDTAIFIPSSDLLPNTYYTATITNGVADLAGNFMVNNYVWNFTTAAATVSAPPILDSTTPASGATGVCLNAAISATFSTAMNATATSVNTTTFAVTGPGGLVTGTYSQDITGTIITFTPASNLTPLTTYTVTINGVTDLAGTPLGSPGLVPNPWSFQTGSATSCLAPVPLGVATPFGGFGGGAGMTNQGSNTVINGDIGTTGASSTMTGFHDTTEPYIAYSEGCIYTESGYKGTVNGEIFTDGPTLPTVASCPNEGTAATMAVATQARADALTAYNALAAMPSDFGCPGSGNGAGLTLPPGVYTCPATTFKISLGDLTLDAGGNANAVWVFQIGSALTVGTASVASSVKLINGAQPQNVFWQAATGAVINYGGGGTMVGTIIALTGGVTISSPGVATITTLNGRALSLGASVTMVNTVINVPGQ